MKTAIDDDETQSEDIIDVVKKFIYSSKTLKSDWSLLNILTDVLLTPGAITASRKLQLFL